MKPTIIYLTIFSFIGEVLGQDCDQVLSRPNIYKMSDADRNRYFDAVKAVNSGSKPTAWDKFAQEHVKVFDQIHGKPMFDAWHRKYLAEMEKLLRSKNPKVRIPYWDWSEYRNNRDNDPIWRWFGKEGNRNQNKCVTEGVFKDFKVFYGDDLNDPGRVKCLTRNDKIDSTFGCVSQEINDNIIDKENPNDSWSYLEYNCHNGVHSAIGEGFSSLISTNDPLFYSHHAFVDNIWFTKQMRYPSRYDSYAQNTNDRIPTWNIPIKDVLDPTSLCYSYKEDRYSWTPRTSANSRSVQSTQSTIRVEPFVPLAEARSALGATLGAASVTAIDDHARKYVFKNITSPVNKPPSELRGYKCEINPLRDIVSIDYIRMMRLDEVKTRELERQQAIYMENLNKQCL